MFNAFSSKKTTVAPAGAGNAAMGVFAVEKAASAAMPSAAVIDKQFAALLDELGLPKAARDAALRQNTEQKWTMLQSRVKKEAEKHNGGSSASLTSAPANSGSPVASAAAATIDAGKTPEAYVRDMRRDKEMSATLLEALKVELTTCDREWLQRFFAAGGLDALAHVTTSAVRGERLSAVRVCLESLKATMKLASDLERAVECAALIPAIVSALLTVDLPAGTPAAAAPDRVRAILDIRALALRLLAVVLVGAPPERDCHSVVEAAFERARTALEEEARYETLVTMLAEPVTASSLGAGGGCVFEQWTVKGALLVFVNEFVDAHEALEDRVALRACLEHAGLMDALEAVGAYVLHARVLAAAATVGLGRAAGEAGEAQPPASPLQLAVDLVEASVDTYYRNMTQDDAAAMTATGGRSVSDPGECFEEVLAAASAAGTLEQLLSVLRCLAVIPAQAGVGRRMWARAAAALQGLVLGTAPSSSSSTNAAADGVVGLSFNDMGLLVEQQGIIAQLQAEVEALQLQAAAAPRRGGNRHGATATAESAPESGKLTNAAAAAGAEAAGPSLDDNASSLTDLAASQRALADETARALALQSAMAATDAGFASAQQQAQAAESAAAALEAEAADLRAQLERLRAELEGLRGSGAGAGGASECPQPQQASPVVVLSAGPRPPRLPGGISPANASPPGGSAPELSAGPSAGLPRPPRPGGSPGAVASPAVAAGAPRPPRPGAAGPAAAAGPAGPRPGRPAGGAPGAVALTPVPAVPAGRAKKTRPKPGAKLKPLFWTKLLDSSVEQTLFKDLSDDKALATLNTRALEELFCQQQSDGPASPAPGGGAKKSLAAAAAAAGPVLLLDPKRQQNGGIGLARVRMRPAEVRRAVLAADTAALPADKLQILLAVVPTQEEVAMIADYEGDRAGLGQLEQFFAAVSTVPRYEQRLLAMLFSLRLDAMAAEARAKLDAVRAAVDALKNSTSLRALLEYVLAVGNYLNADSGARGGAYGFKLDTLKKLAAVKGGPLPGDGKGAAAVTLVDFLARAALDEGRSRGMARLHADLAPVQAARALSLEAVVADVRAIERGLQQTATQVGLCARAAAHAAALEGDRFEAALGPFAEGAAATVRKLVEDAAACSADFKDLVSSYAEEATDTSAFFPLFADFAAEFKRALEKEEERRSGQGAGSSSSSSSSKKGATSGSGNAVTPAKAGGAGAASTSAAADSSSTPPAPAAAAASTTAGVAVAAAGCAAGKAKPWAAPPATPPPASARRLLGGGGNVVDALYGSIAAQSTTGGGGGGGVEDEGRGGMMADHLARRREARRSFAVAARANAAAVAAAAAAVVAAGTGSPSAGAHSRSATEGSGVHLGPPTPTAASAGAVSGDAVATAASAGESVSAAAAGAEGAQVVPRPPAYPRRGTAHRRSKTVAGMLADQVAGAAAATFPATGSGVGGLFGGDADTAGPDATSDAAAASSGPCADPAEGPRPLRPRKQSFGVLQFLHAAAAAEGSLAAVAAIGGGRPSSSRFQAQAIQRGHRRAASAAQEHAQLLVQSQQARGAFLDEDEEGLEEEAQTAEEP